MFMCRHLCQDDSYSASERAASARDSLCTGVRYAYILLSVFFRQSHSSLSISGLPLHTSVTSSSSPDALSSRATRQRQFCVNGDWLCQVPTGNCNFRSPTESTLLNQSPNNTSAISTAVPNLVHILPLGASGRRVNYNQFLPRDAAMLARCWESQFCPSVRLSVCPSVTRVLCD